MTDFVKKNIPIRFQTGIMKITVGVWEIAFIMIFLMDASLKYDEAFTIKEIGKQI